MEIVEALGNIGFNWQVALANLVNFLIIFYLLKRFAWGPINNVLTKREETIREGLENAEKAKRDAVMAAEDRERVLQEARAEGNQIITSASQKAGDIVSQADSLAKQKRDQIVDDARIIIEKDKQKKAEEFKAESAELIVAGIEKVLQENFDHKQQEAFIKKVIS